jgi:hypothetical protein
MSKFAMQVFLVALVAWSGTQIADGAEAEKKAADTKDAKTKDTVTIDKVTCKASNDFEYTKCGSGTDILCCKTREKCVGPEKPKTGLDMYVCSAERQLTGSKAVKIVILPMFGLILDIVIIAFMVVKLNIGPNHVTKLCAAVIALSWPLFFSKLWALGFYAAFLALLVAFMSEQKNAPWWIYRLAWALAVFQVIALFGPYETFHVPFYGQSKAPMNQKIISSIGTEAQCDTYFEKYFTRLSIEKKAKDADPDLTYYGLCTMQWLATIQTFCLFQGMVWMALIVLSAPTLLTLPLKDPVTELVGA